MTEIRNVPAARTDLHDTRYGELLFATLGENAITAEVWTTSTLNECPAELWDPIDAQAEATRRGAAFGLKNGPRYWLIDEIQRASVIEDIELAKFGGLDMVRVAKVTVDAGNLAAGGYREVKVDRRTLFTWKAGRRVYELTNSEGVTYVMQAYSQIVDPTLKSGDLEHLGDVLKPPEGWRYGSRVLEGVLLVDTRTTEASVLQDELQNSYSRLA
jgi:hypothetical protein